MIRISVLGMAVLTTPMLASGQAAPGTIDIAVNFTNAKVGSAVHACLWTVEAGFPMCDETAAYHAIIDAEHGVATHVFRDLPPGIYAAGGFNDVDADGRLDRNLFGFPQEPMAVFLDGERPEGRPRFEKVALRFEASAQLDLELRRIERR